MTLKELLLGLIIAVLLIAIFSTMVSSAVELPIAKSGLPTISGDTGVTVSGDGSEPANMTIQTTISKEEVSTDNAETANKSTAEIMADESSAEQAANEPTNTLSKEQGNNCNLVSVFLSGVASVLFVELIIEIKNKI